MASSTTVRELRNHFPKVRKLVETEGEVVLTENGKPKYRLLLYTAPRITKAPAVDYWARLNSYQTTGLTESQARAVQDDNRGER